ncbi:MAG: peptidoglycan DD-metalloendopeptidase family protein [Bacteroidales bacterium]|nr:peptidoglycan DD-metalloendopeptidase family protein [Bacteroidales bacterium]MDE7072890.1 peptidoglycan DD-metalloendopeptidase family protein [Bacteroidales bacterium]
MKYNILWQSFVWIVLCLSGTLSLKAQSDTVITSIPNPYADIEFLEVFESRDDSSSARRRLLEDLEEEEISELWQLRESFAYTSFNPNVLHYRHPNEVINGNDTVWISLVDSGRVYTHPYRGRLTSPFGFRWGRMHYGTDVGLRIGDTIRAAFDGIVRIAQRNYSYGNIVILFHKNGLETYYAHMSRLLVHPNQVVKSGDPIGLGGNTGRSKGPHLHLEVRYLGAPIDPQYIIDFYSYKLKEERFPVCKETLYGVSSSGARWHKIKSGETLSSIARKYRTSVNQIRVLNGMKSNKIRAGATIRVR